MKKIRFHFHDYFLQTVTVKMEASAAGEVVVTAFNELGQLLHKEILPFKRDLAGQPERAMRSFIHALLDLVAYDISVTRVTAVSTLIKRAREIITSGEKNEKEE